MSAFGVRTGLLTEKAPTQEDGVLQIHLKQGQS